MAKKYKCINCKYFVENKCEHSSNIYFELQKRTEKKVYKSLKPKTECEFCLIKN